jgi:hypothetical protein
MRHNLFVGPKSLRCQGFHDREVKYLKQLGALKSLVDPEGHAHNRTIGHQYRLELNKFQAIGATEGSTILSQRGDT